MEGLSRRASLRLSALWHFPYSSEACWEFANVTCRWHIPEYSLNLRTHTWSARIRTCCKMCFNEEQLVWFCSNKRYLCKRVATCLPILHAASKWALLSPTPAGVTGPWNHRPRASSLSEIDSEPRSCALCHCQIAGHSGEWGCQATFLHYSSKHSSNWDHFKII